MDISFLAPILAIPHIQWVVGGILITLLLVSIFGNIGIDWENKKFTFGSRKANRIRTCSDCIRLLMAKRTAFEVIYTTKQTNILRQQMIFAEHKLTEIEHIVKFELRNSIKDEIRRSFKENGFFEMDENDYNEYIKERVDILTTMINSEDIKIPPIIKQMYDNAKNVKTRLDAEIKKLEDDFVSEINTIISEKN